MSTIMCFIRTDTKIQASNESATIDLSLPLDHPVAKLFPQNSAVLFAKCRVTREKLTVLNACKPWRTSK